MHKVNAGFTLLARLDPARVEAAATLLVELHEQQERLPFAQSTTTHFATITIIPAQRYHDDVLPATLLFATSFCGPARVHVSELVRIMGDGLRAVFQHCEGFERDWSDDAVEQFMLQHRRGDTFYSGMQHLSPEDVRRHRQLRDAIEAFVDERQAEGGLRGSPLEVKREIQAHVLSRPELAWARDPFEPTLGAKLAFLWRSLLLEAAVAALLVSTIVNAFVDSGLLGAIVWGGWLAVVAFVLFVGVLFLSVRVAESKQAYVSRRASDERARLLASTQMRPVINEFTLAGPIKPEGVLRPLTLRFALWIVGRVADGLPGVPSYGNGINIPTVATARWIVTDGGRRLMFISNYTNEGVAYVRDFIETSAGAKRINLSFGFGSGYPRTRWIFLDGAETDPNAYLHSLGENQTPTLFWYGPYRDMSIDNIKVNRQIREGLFAEHGESKAREWLQLL